MNKTFVVSDESTNSYGFNVLTDGIDLSRFEKNPIMFYQHDSQKVIGKWENVRKEGNQLLADAVFDTESELGKEVSRKVEQGFLKATSLGISFQRTDLSSDNKLSKCLLHEISIVSIGSNHNALKLYNDDSDSIVLEFFDEGVGLPSDVDVGSFDNLGFTIVKSLVGQLNGNVNVMDLDKGFGLFIKF